MCPAVLGCSPRPRYRTNCTADDMRPTIAILLLLVLAIPSFAQDDDGFVPLIDPEQEKAENYSKRAAVIKWRRDYPIPTAWRWQR